MKKRLVALVLLMALVLSFAPGALARTVEGFTKAELKQALKDGDMYTYAITARATVLNEKGKPITDTTYLVGEKLYAFKKADLKSKNKVVLYVLRQGYDKNRETAWYVKDVVVCYAHQLVKK